MTITTDDCKALLSRDMPLIACGAIDPKGWKRLSKKNGANGVERVFSHDSGMFALVIESAGAIKVGARSPTLEGLDSAKTAAAPAAAVVAPAAELEAASRLWPAVSPRFLDVEKARVLAEKIAHFWENDDDDDAMEKYTARCDKLDPIALASQYTFAICLSDDGLVAIVTPTCVWEDDGYCHDQESPIGRLMPAGSDDLNGCGTWQIPGYDSADDVPKLAFDLMERGFVWDPDFQEMIDENQDQPSMPLLTPIVEGRALEASAKSGASHGRAPRV